MQDNKWKPLPTMANVAAARAQGWEIEWNSAGKGYCPWHGAAWYDSAKYRGRPRQLKTKKVKLLAWIDNWGELRRVKEDANWPKSLIRVPSEDKEIEIPDND